MGIFSACELNRLFRTEFFNLSAAQCCRYDFTFREKQVSFDFLNGNLLKDFLQILFGQCWYENSLKNYRQQTSPLMAEFLNPRLNKEILKIGKEKYFG